MSKQKVRVTAEWALRGKSVNDSGYRILECSDGVVGLRNFDTALSRYSPGTLDYLPQVTISWLSGQQKSNYLAIAIHDVSEAERYDARGREIVFTRYFCVPYDELAAGAVCYHAMYEGFRGCQLPVPDRNLITTELSVAAPARARPAADAAGGLPGRVAALLLTDQPVCVLGAERVGLDERLLFLDSVMSMLPFGMRSRLSASTWVSSTYQGHKFRLFFTSAPREANDHVVYWDRDGHEPIRDSHADAYLAWLTSRQPSAQLAQLTQPMDFSRKAVLEMLELAGTTTDSPPSDQASGRTGSHALRRTHPPEPARVMSAADLLVSCAVMLNEASPRFRGSDLEMLRSHLADPPAGAEREHCRSLIKRHRLLRADLPLDSRMQQDFYAVLLRLVFEIPLTYPDYCEVEACVDDPEGKPLHSALMQVLLRLGLDRRDLGLFVIALESFGPAELGRFFDANHVALDALLSAAADPNLRPAHVRTLCTVTLWYLGERRGRFDRRALRAALREHRYLAPVLEQRHADDPEYQLNALTELLRAAYGDELGRREAAEVLDTTQSLPTPALIAAVLRMAAPADAGLAAQDLIRTLLNGVRLDSSSRARLAPLLRGDEQQPASPDLERPDPPPGSPTRSLLRRGRSAFPDGFHWREEPSS